MNRLSSRVWYGNLNNMFDKLKQMKQIRDIQNTLKKEKFTKEKGGVRVVVNGTLAVEEIILNPDLGQDRQAMLVKDCINDAMRDAQMAMAKQFQGMGGQIGM